MKSLNEYLGNKRLPYTEYDAALYSWQEKYTDFIEDVQFILTPYKGRLHMRVTYDNLRDHNGNLYAVPRLVVTLNTAVNITIKVHSSRYPYIASGVSGGKDVVGYTHVSGPQGGRDILLVDKDVKSVFDIKMEESKKKSSPRYKGVMAADDFYAGYLLKQKGIKSDHNSRLVWKAVCKDTLSLIDIHNDNVDLFPQFIEDLIIELADPSHKSHRNKQYKDIAEFIKTKHKRALQFYKIPGDSLGVVVLEEKGFTCVTKLNASPEDGWYQDLYYVTTNPKQFGTFNLPEDFGSWDDLVVIEQ